MFSLLKVNNHLLLFWHFHFTESRWLHDAGKHINVFAWAGSFPHRSLTQEFHFFVAQPPVSIHLLNRNKEHSKKRTFKTKQPVQPRAKDKEETAQWCSGPSTVKSILESCLSRMTSLKGQCLIVHHKTLYDGNLEQAFWQVQFFLVWFCFTALFVFWEKFLAMLGIASIKGPLRDDGRPLAGLLHCRMQWDDQSDRVSICQHAN